MNRYTTSQRHLLLALTLLVALPLTGCVNQQKRDPAFSAVRPSATMPVQLRNGAIYQAGQEMAWFEDQRARRVGDILTVMLEETTNASKESKTSLSKDNSTSINSPTLLGTALGAARGGFGTSLGSANSFEGSGKSDQKNSLSGTITVTVAEVLPNGYLHVRGEKVLTLNRGDEYVRISGIVRPIDITPDNMVSSTRIADAEIAYSGRGEVADTNVIGWLARFFVSALMPF
jgi:flagellar L-ring protein precursor FlgH